MSKPKPDLILYASDSHGVYIPKYFAESIQRHRVRGVTQEEFDILEAGPDHEHYWDVWDGVLMGGSVVADECTYRLDQDGDLRLVPVDMEWNEDRDRWEYPFEGESFTGPACWAPYLINGDASGLEDAEHSYCDKVTEGLGACVDAIDQGFLSNPDYGLAGNCCEYRFEKNKMTYLKRFIDYAPEFYTAFKMCEDKEFLRELNSEEVTGAAFSVCDAFSEFWAAWHGGQNSRIYALGSNFGGEFNYDHRSSDMDDNSQTRDFYACLCVAFDVDDPIRWEIFGPNL